jgi:8-oxo-dGTP pyrophosphatase MutT (NUDIX family)
METVLVAKALVIDSEGNCLVLRRSKTHPDSALKPDLPGGQLDEAETPISAVCREITEETGLRIDETKVHLLFATTDASRGRNVIRHVLATKLPQAKPNVTISWEHDSAQWIPLGEVLGFLEHPEYTKGIAHILENHLLEDIT